MKNSRNVVNTILIISILLFSIFSGIVIAADNQFPTKPITAIVPFGAGGGTDRSVRALAKVWEKYSDVRLNIVNMPGAGSAEGMKFVFESNPDGYTIVQNGSQMLTLPYFYTIEELGWSLGEFEPIAIQQTIPYILVVPKDSPFNSLEELIKFGKEHPGHLMHGVVGYGGDSHVAFKALELAADFKATVVPFDSGADQVANIAGSHIDVAVASFGTMIPLVQSGDAKALAVALDERSSAIPNVPTSIELGVDWDFPNWRGWLAPPGTPRNVINYIADIIEKALIEDDELKEMIMNVGEEPKYYDPDEMGDFLFRMDDIFGPAIKAILEEDQ